MPSWAALAPAARTAAIWAPRMMPPAATIGRLTASRIWATSDSRPVPEPPVSGLSRWVPWWPPASTPCAITASAPDRSTARASSAVVAVTRAKVPTRCRESTTSRLGTPKWNDTTGTGLSSSTASLVS